MASGAISFGKYRMLESCANDIRSPTRVVMHEHYHAKMQAHGFACCSYTVKSLVNRLCCKQNIGTARGEARNK